MTQFDNIYANYQTRVKAVRPSVKAISNYNYMNLKLRKMLVILRQQ